VQREVLVMDAKALLEKAQKAQLVDGVVVVQHAIYAEMVKVLFEKVSREDAEELKKAPTLPAIAKSCFEIADWITEDLSDEHQRHARAAGNIVALLEKQGVLQRTDVANAGIARLL
jgi:hypothetical protein